MRELGLIGLIGILFGLGSYQMMGELSAFIAINLLLGVGALAGAMFMALLRLGHARQPALRRPIERSLGSTIAVIALCVGAYWLAAWSEIRFDWTFEGQFQLAEATVRALDELNELDDPLIVTLYYDGGDPRTRSSRLLLEEMARGRDFEVRSRAIDEHPEDEDRFGIGSSNTVVLELGRSWERVDRPTEGALFEGLSRLRGGREVVVYISAGAGEGDLERGDALGYSGLRAALESEGYEPRPLPLALLDRIPDDAGAVIVIAARREIPGRALYALRRYIEGGGSLIAFVEPGRQSGIEGLLAQYGLSTPNAFVVDPTSHPVEGDLPGIELIAFNYAKHPVTHGLNRNRMTFFSRARAFDLEKRDPSDRLRGVVFSSGEAWRVPADELSSIDSSLRPPDDAVPNYQPIVAVAELQRQWGRSRLLVFGDSDFVSNRHLRALYNLDLVMNGIHWAVDREPAITIRPKSGGRQLIQFPVPLQRSMSALYGVGLLIPELLILAGGLIWLRDWRA
jgi:hypothetical protein